MKCLRRVFTPHDKLDVIFSGFILFPSSTKLCASVSTPWRPGDQSSAVYQNTDALQRREPSPQLPPTQLVYLSRWRRLGASLIEALIWGCAGGALGAITFGILTPVVLIGNLAYLAFFVWYFGGNIGHLALGARVVNHRNGGTVGPGRAVGRAVASLLDLLIVPGLINCGMALFRADRRYLYNLMAGTVVIYDRRASGDPWTRVAPR